MSGALLKILYFDVYEGLNVKSNSDVPYHQEIIMLLLLTQLLLQWEML